ncbi:MAG: recombination protein F [Methanoregula sp. PtaU1.Bin051]|nr:MAG: recombination protein F [Methanoregula sp. PtaU1.Bin051]
MKILDVHLCNFKNYCGEHIIDLSSNGVHQKNIILIGGLNGAGKTTIFEAIKICLFGKNFNGKNLSKTQYDRLVLSYKNQTSNRQNDDRFFIQIKIELDDVFPVYTIDLHREWLIHDNKVEEKFVILRNSYPLEIITQEYWEDFIKKLIPPYISDYFFFDGERIRELTIGDKAESILHDSIRDLIGLKLYETLINDLDSLQSKLKQKNIDNEATLETLKQIQMESEKMQNEIEKKETQLRNEALKISQSTNHINEIEADLHRKAGKIAKNREKIQGDLTNLRDKIDNLNRDIIKYCDYVPFVITSELCKKVVKQMILEKEIKESLTNKNFLEQINESLLKRLEQNSQKQLNEIQIKLLKNEINSIFSDMTQNLVSISKKPLIHDLTNSKTEYYISFFSNIEKKGKTEFSDKLRQREQLMLKIRKYEKELKKSPNDDLVKTHIEEISRERAIIELSQKNISEIEKERSELREKINQLNEQIRILENKSVCAIEDKLKIDVCRKISTSLDEFIKVILASKTEELGRTVTQMYRNLANKEDLIREIKIDSTTLTPQLLNAKGELINKDELSAGEKEIFALSILWGLSKLSNSQLPVIVDSLLARLDTSHVDKIVKNFFPKAGDQVVVLSHDREVDENLYRKIVPFISRSYLISIEENERDKIKRGYFFE